MANKQTIAAPHLGGQNLLQQVHSSSTYPVLKRESEDDFMLSTARMMMNAPKKYFKQTNTIKNDNLRLKADTVLNVCREQLYQAQTDDDFNEVVKNTPLMLESCFDGSDDEKKFWQEHGANLLNAHQLDVKNIRVQKNGEFEQNNLNQMLNETQKVLGETTIQDAENVLEQGVSAIDCTEYLNDDEKKVYRQKYLAGGILNLALQNSEQAERALQQYLPNDEALKMKIAKVRELQIADQKKAQEKQLYAQKMSALYDAVQLWQRLEKKQINPAQYFVLSQIEGEVPMLEDDGKYLQTPIAAVYRAMRQNKGEKIEAEQIREWQNYLISAYRQKEMDLDDVAWLQNNLLSKSYTGQSVLDEEICMIADKNFGNDKDERTTDALNFMEKKAKFVFGILPDYEEKLSELTEDFTKSGAYLSSGMKKYLAHKAAKKVAEMYELKVDAKMV